MVKNNQTIITTFGEDIYIVNGTPDEVVEKIQKGGDNVRMPNGSWINKKAFATYQSYEDYNFQTEQKQRHKKGQFLKSGEWHDHQGSLGISSHLERITGEIGTKTLLPTPKKALNG